MRGKRNTESCPEKTNCQTTGVVYKYEMTCGITYIGECYDLHNRHKQHKFIGPLKEHIKKCQTCKSLDETSIEILDVEKNNYARIKKEFDYKLKENVFKNGLNKMCIENVRRIRIEDFKEEDLKVTCNTCKWKLIDENSLKRHKK